MALTRTEKAVSMPVTQVPTWFQHSITPGKPTPPTVTGLSAADTDVFNEWLQKRENGVIGSRDFVNLTPELQAVMQTYEAYYATPAFHAWTATDYMSRVTQWRFAMVDVIEAVNAKGTTPPSFDSAGLGTAAPSVDEIVNSGANDPLPGTSPQYVTTGSPPELVYGDDGSIVTSFVTQSTFSAAL